jgi:Raf kinase inhibitor-like YbhB/YbcL family protein
MRVLSRTTLLQIGFGVLVVLASTAGVVHTSSNEAIAAAQLRIGSTAFTNGNPVPKQYTADGANTSPPIWWTNIPNGTKSIALICDDPDAPKGTWTHWVIYNIPAKVPGLGAGYPTAADLPNGAKQGTNSFQKTGWGGPDPPAGKPHHYIFTVYALNTTLNTQSGATADQLRGTMNNHILGQGQLTGTYGR